LIDTVMRLGREGRALAGFEIHEILPDRSALQCAPRIMRFVEQG
jgi:hypothetical protein